MSPNYEFSVLCSSVTVDQSVVGNKGAGAGGTYVAPLYIYPTEKRGLFDEESSARQPNFSNEFLGDFYRKLKSNFKPELIKDLPRQSKPHLTSPSSLSFSPEDIFN